MTKEDIKKLYATPILYEPYKSCRKPLEPDDILLTPIEVYKGLSRIDNSTSDLPMLFGMLVALLIITLFL